MHRNSDGHLVISKTVLGTIISACIAAGGGGAWFTTATAGESVSAKVVEHQRLDDARDAVAAAQIQALKEQLNRMEQTLNKLDDKIDRMRRRP